MAKKERKFVRKDIWSVFPMLTWLARIDLPYLHLIQFYYTLTLSPKPTHTPTPLLSPKLMYSTTGAQPAPATTSSPQPHATIHSTIRIIHPHNNPQTQPLSNPTPPNPPSFYPTTNKPTPIRTHHHHQLLVTPPNPAPIEPITTKTTPTRGVQWREIESTEKKQGRAAVITAFPHASQRQHAVLSKEFILVAIVAAEIVVVAAAGINVVDMVEVAREGHKCRRMVVVTGEDDVVTG